MAVVTVLQCAGDVSTTCTAYQAAAARPGVDLVLREERVLCAASKLCSAASPSWLVVWCACVWFVTGCVASSVCSFFGRGLPFREGSLSLIERLDRRLCICMRKWLTPSCMPSPTCMGVHRHGIVVVTRLSCTIVQAHHSLCSLHTHALSACDVQHSTGPYFYGCMSAALVKFMHACSC